MNKENFRIITCTNEKELYIHFWPSMAQNWTKWYGIEKITCAVITDRDENDPVIQEMKKYGEIILVKPLKNIVTDDIQSKATRLYLATQYPDDYCIIADVDMYILNKTETWDKWFSRAEKNKLLCISRNAPYSGADIGKFPMAFTTATGSVWKEIVNPSDLTYEELFKSWYDMNEHDSMEKVNQPFRQFSDESLLRGLISKWENYGGKYGYDHPRCIGIEREDWSGERATRRIDRLYWHINKTLLESGGYYDSQPVRPFNRSALQPILEYLNIK